MLDINELFLLMYVSALTLSKHFLKTMSHKSWLKKREGQIHYVIMQKVAVEKNEREDNMTNHKKCWNQGG